ncbi:Secreted RxLR effector peptide protein [Phytophthora cinnamomi]|uniref:Secreted RxLR effector peptide protein n=1 Tax=Phytophthora cinnamomi TaxID=4785 RepID=UPI00355A6F34|nr:Secreted RxLR effector peptide protein [Phytophthora cinnamomi]
MDDGLDDGTDDPELLKNVAAAARAQMDKITREFSADARARREAGMDGSGSEQQEEEEDSPPERTEVAEAAGAGAEQNESSVPDAPTGITLLRDNSTIDVRLAREFGLLEESSGEDVDEDKPRATPVEDSGNAAPTEMAGAVPATPKRKQTGRPRRKAAEARPTLTSPSRTPLRRNPGNNEEVALQVNGAFAAALGEQKVGKHYYNSFLMQAVKTYDQWPESMRYRVWLKWDDAITLLTAKNHPEMAEIVMRARDAAARTR